MKKTLLVIVLAFIGQQSMGQVQAGSIFVTGFGSIYTEGGETSTKIGGTTTTTDHDKYFEGTFGVGGGYFLSDNIAVGAGISLMGSKMTPADTADPEVKTNGFGFNVMARYYVPMSDNFYFFGQLSYAMMNSSSIMKQGGTETEGPKFSANMVGIQPGFTFFPTSNIGLDLTFGNIGWWSTKTKTDLGNNDSMESTSSGMDVSFDLTTITFGVQYFFGGN